MFTVWQLESPSTGERKRVVHRMYPDDHRYSHSYQRIIWQGEARNRAEALKQAALTDGI